MKSDMQTLVEMLDRVKVQYDFDRQGNTIVVHPIAEDAVVFGFTPDGRLLDVFSKRRS